MDLIGIALDVLAFEQSTPEERLHRKHTKALIVWVSVVLVTIPLMVLLVSRF